MTALLTLLLGIGLFIWGVHFAVTRASLGLLISLMALFARHSFGVTTILQFGSVSLSATDMATLVLLVAGIARLAFIPSERPAVGLPVAMFALYVVVEACVIAFSLVSYGEASFQVSRNAVGHIACIVYFLSFRLSAERMKSWFRVIGLYGAAIAALAVARAMHLIPLAPSVVSTLGASSYTRFRYIVNYQSLALAYIVLVLLLLRWAGLIRGTARLYAAVSGLLIIVAVVPQRMVWLLFALGCVYLAGTHTRKALTLAALAVAITVMVLPVVIGLVGGEPLRAVSQAVYDAALGPVQDFSSSTGGNRIMDWQVLVASTIESGQAVFGRGYVPTLARYVGRWNVLEYGIHNLLVSKFVYGGLALTGSTVLFWASLMWAFAKTAIRCVPLAYKQVLGLGATGILLFSFTSVPTLELGIALGVCLRFVCDARADRLEPEHPDLPSGSFQELVVAPAQDCAMTSQIGYRLESGTAVPLARRVRPASLRLPITGVSWRSCFQSLRQWSSRGQFSGYLHIRSVRS